MADFSRLTSALQDRYRIERELGVGGMATVFLAHDVKHDRKVALKVLKPELGAVLGGERFVSEIRVTANLQHPHILALYDSGEADGLLYYVMPYVEGETLRDKLAREKQLGIDEAIGIARSVASALDYAHRREVVHRDIKPENILLHEGQPLVADFGIALAVSAAGGTRLTETGLSLGTPHYMSPEQATADRELDARSDIYSLACVLYEMLAGQPPHTAASAQAVVAKILTEEPAPITTHRRTVPTHVAATIEQALSKLPADRFPEASQFAEALVTPGLSRTRSAATSAVWPTSRPAPAWVWSIILGLAILAVWGWLRPVPTPEPGILARFTVRLPPTEQLGNQPGNRVVVSPDGRQVVYVGEGPDGRQLYLLPLRNQQARLVAGTKNASQPFFSPDSRSVGFNGLGGLYRIALNGGAPQRLATEGSFGASWGEDGVIIYSAQQQQGLVSVPENGGEEPVVITRPDTAAGEMSHTEPVHIPGTRAAVFQTNFRDVDGSQISVVDLGNGEIKHLTAGRSPRITPTGYLVYTSDDGVMRAALFDRRRLELSGPPSAVLEGVNIEDIAAEYSIANNGTLVYVSRANAEERALVLVDRNGGERVVTRQPRVFYGPQFSPDGRKVAIHLSGGSGSGFDVWIVDLLTNDLRKFTLNQQSFFPSWTPDGRFITYARRTQRGVNIYRKRADGAGEEEGLFTHEGDQWEASWTPDGRTAVVRQNAPNTGNRNLWLWTVGTEPAGVPLVETEANERSPAVSPSGSYFAFASDESGRSEVYVQALGSEGRWQISTAGGTEPAWSPDERELFYRSGDQILAVPIQTNPVFSNGTPAVAISGPYAAYSTHVNYDVDSNGQRFVMVKVGDSESQLVVIVNWFEALKNLGRSVD
jgi:serine/threonine-protein kinase